MNVEDKYGIENLTNFFVNFIDKSTKVKKIIKMVDFTFKRVNYTLSKNTLNIIT